MKDKLAKSGHNRYYYAFRRLGKAVFGFALLAVAASVPVLVAYGVSVEQALAQEAPEEEESTSENGFQIISYFEN